MGLFSAVSAAIAGGLNVAGMPLQDYYNRKAASQANDYNWSMWQATNEYNTPANQMKRFKEAGLNENLIYGQTNTTSPMAMTGPNAPDAQGALSKAGQSIMDYYTIKNAKASNDKLNAEIAGINAGIKNQNVKTMSDFWDLMQRVRGGYGSDSSWLGKMFGDVYNIGHRGGRSFGNAVAPNVYKQKDAPSISRFGLPVLKDIPVKGRAF